MSPLEKMTTATTDDMVPASAIFRGPPLDLSPRRENLRVDDLLSLSPAEVLSYRVDLREDLESVRALMHAAVSLTADLTATNRKLAAANYRLREEISDLCRRLREARP